MTLPLLAKSPSGHIAQIPDPATIAPALVQAIGLAQVQVPALALAQVLFLPLAFPQAHSPLSLKAVTLP